MITTKESFFDRIKKEFADEIVLLSGEKISRDEAIKIANRKLRPTDFNDDSPLQHKSVKWLAMNYLDLV